MYCVWRKSPMPDMVAPADTVEALRVANRATHWIRMVHIERKKEGY